MDADGGISLVEQAVDVRIPSGWGSSPTARAETAPFVRTGRHSGPSRRRLVVAVLVTLVVLLAIMSLFAAVGVRADNRTAGNVAARRAEVRATVHELALAHAALDSAAEKAGAAGRALAAASATLATDQAALARTQADVWINGVSIGDLDTCLSDVEQALNAVSLGNPSQAASILTSADAACRAVETSVGA
ncbi:MAG TPA: hypothetical protein VEJ44_04420 [Acidimicrobiales bacterium]|nr:hypothetical protein [Acidimicrobiales bacterium]